MPQAGIKHAPFAVHLGVGQSIRVAGMNVLPRHVQACGIEAQDDMDLIGLEAAKLIELVFELFAGFELHAGKLGIHHDQVPGGNVPRMLVIARAEQIAKLGP